MPRGTTFRLTEVLKRKKGADTIRALKSLPAMRVVLLVRVTDHAYPFVVVGAVVGFLLLQFSCDTSGGDIRLAGHNRSAAVGGA